MGQQAPRPAAILTAVAFALSVFGFTLFVWKSFGGSIPLEPKGYRFHVLLGADASNLTSGSEARISGVEVGRVVKVERRFDRTEAEVELKSKYAPLSSRSRAVIRSKTLLGETFIEFTPGSRADPKLGDGATLPPSQVSQAQGLDQVLGAFDEPTRANLKRFLRDLSASLEGRGEDLNAALGNAGPTLDDLQRLVVILDGQRPALRRLVADGGDALQAIGDRQEAVGTLVRSGNDLLAATAARDRDLTATIEQLPGFLAQLRSVLSEADATALDAAPTLAAIRPVAPLVRPALDSLAGLVNNAIPLTAELGPVIDAGRRGLPQATRVVNAAKPLLDELNPAGSNLVPILRVIRDYRKDIIAALANVGAASQGTAARSDGAQQHYLRILPPVLNDAVLGYSRRQGTSRANPYHAPGGLGKIASGGLQSFNCATAGNPQATPPLGSTAPCVQEPAWNYNGIVRQFPHIEQDP